MLFRSYDKDRAAQLAERIRQVVERHTEWGRRGMPTLSPGGGGVTVSLGVAASPGDGAVEEALIRVADERMYRAKRDGRNRVCAA